MSEIDKDVDYSDPYWFKNKKLKKDSETTKTKNSNNINPTLPRNNTPRQDVSRIAGLLERTGLPTIWEQATPCPCINPETNQPKTDCPLCFGRGFIYREMYTLTIAYTSDDRGAYFGSQGQQDHGVTTGTPQVTENGIEDGIAIRDRLTIKGINLSNTYIANVSERRYRDGFLIPYQVVEFNNVISIDDKFNVYQLKQGEDFEYDARSSMFKVLNPKLKGRNISMNLSTQLRYYVSNITKETRVADIKKMEDKKVLTDNGNIKLDNYYQVDLGDAKYFRMPKKLVLRREDMFIGASDFTADSTNEKSKSHIFDAKEYDSSINRFMGGV